MQPDGPQASVRERRRLPRPTARGQPRAPCSESYDSSSTVTLTATPAAGSTVAGWFGCDTVSGATCTVTMNSARTVTATFTVQKFTLTVQKTRLQTGNGTVTSSSN